MTYQFKHSKPAWQVTSITTEELIGSSYFAKTPSSFLEIKGNEVQKRGNSKRKIQLRCFKNARNLWSPPNDYPGSMELDETQAQYSNDDRSRYRR